MLKVLAINCPMPNGINSILQEYPEGARVTTANNPDQLLDAMIREEKGEIHDRIICFKKGISTELKEAMKVLGIKPVLKRKNKK